MAEKYFHREESRINRSAKKGKEENLEEMYNEKRSRQERVIERERAGGWTLESNEYKVFEAATAKEGMLVTLSEKESKKPNELTKRLTKDLKKSGRVTAELEGRFEGADDRRWGHQACCRFRLQVERVISLK